MPFPTRATRTILTRAFREGRVPRTTAMESLALLDTLTGLRRARVPAEESPEHATWGPFLEELLQPSPPGAAPRCFLAARLLAEVEDPALLAAALKRHLPAAVLGKAPPARAPIPYVEADAYEIFEDIPV